MENARNIAFKDFGKRDGMTTGQVADVFTKVADTYDEYMFQLWTRGFRQIDGLDPSTGMMTEAMKKGVYTDYYLEFMDGHTIGKLATDSYDGLVAAAAFNTGLLPCAALLEMARLVKPGGLICFGIPHACFTDVKEYNNRLEPLMQRMELDGMWKLLDKKHHDDFYDNANPGNVFRYIVHASDVDVKYYVEKLCHAC
ncbi:uncharacterized protein LOC124124392 isoform X2 [Haliotis rufescens]|uniref:uncharacterized protein LOC124124392 isoform X2 n=1 Tax=Haliotis rufescens TaxID=6454 RepID=UPI00201EF685|nr:uncharacterized protein LOC124124392 isoform X2 [Haliotis rufescens]